MAARHLLIPFAGWHVEHGFDSDPNWRVQEGKGIYIEITICIYIYRYLYIYIYVYIYILCVYILYIYIYKLVNLHKFGLIYLEVWLRRVSLSLGYHGKLQKVGYKLPSKITIQRYDQIKRSSDIMYI